MTGQGNNTYLLVRAGGSAALIDAGVGDRRHLEALAHALALEHARLDEVLVTHAHGDHARGAGALAQAYPGARFRKHPWPEEDARYGVEWLPLQDGERVGTGDDRLTVLFTPGHSPDHLAFWHEASRTVFAGDLVVPGTTVVIGASKGGDMTQYLASLERIRRIDPERLLPAHGPEVTDVETLLDRYVEHRLQRERDVLAALAEGRETVQAITESIYHGLPPALMPAAAENVLAHLEKLRRERRARNERDRWLIP
jgi:glyoxylase-like metal-dependent hydrolase (beta-lactamase superfamily II)